MQLNGVVARDEHHEGATRGHDRDVPFVPRLSSADRVDLRCGEAVYGESGHGLVIFVEKILADRPEDRHRVSVPSVRRWTPRVLSPIAASTRRAGLAPGPVRRLLSERALGEPVALAVDRQSVDGGGPAENVDGSYRFVDSGDDLRLRRDGARGNDLGEAGS